MVVVPVTMIMSQRIGGLLVHRPAPVTFNLSQLGANAFRKIGVTSGVDLIRFWLGLRINTESVSVLLGATTNGYSG